YGKLIETPPCVDVTVVQLAELDAERSRSRVRELELDLERRAALFTRATRLEAAVLEEKLATARLERERAELQLSRTLRLLACRAVSEAEVETARAAFERAVETLEALECMADSKAASATGAAR